MRRAGSALAVLALAAGAAACTSDDGAVDGLGAAPFSVSAARDGADTATLNLMDGAETVTIRTADVGDDLIRVTTAADSRLRPKLDQVEDHWELHLPAISGDVGPAAVEVLLNADVSWGLRLAGGATDMVVDLSGGTVLGVEFATGVAHIDLTMPEPAGDVPVRMAGGASDFTVHLPDGFPARVTVGAGAASVTVDGDTLTGVEAGKVITPDGWDDSERRFDVDAAAGMSTLVVDRHGDG